MTVKTEGGGQSDSRALMKANHGDSPVEGDCYRA